MVNNDKAGPTVECRWDTFDSRGSAGLAAAETIISSARAEAAEPAAYVAEDDASDFSTCPRRGRRWTGRTDTLTSCICLEAMAMDIVQGNCWINLITGV